MANGSGNPKLILTDPISRIIISNDVAYLSPVIYGLILGGMLIKILYPFRVCVYEGDLGDAMPHELKVSTDIADRCKRKTPTALRIHFCVSFLAKILQRM